MSLSLLRKELKEHGWVLLGVLLLDALWLVGFLSQAADAGGRFVGLTRFTATTGVLNALVLAGRVFVREYSGMTQLFLEVLPIGRGRVFATKWLFGAWWMLALTASAWLATLLYQRRREVITLHDAGLVLATTLTFSLLVWAFAAMAGLLGRYRLLAWLLLPMFLYALEELAQIPTESIPVFRLVTDTTATARGELPVGAIALSLGLSLLFLVGAMALTLPGTGAIAATLAQRMTARERAFVASSVLLGSFAIITFKKKPEKPPFRLAEAAHTASRHAQIGVMTSPDVDEVHARAMGEHLALDVDSILEALKLPDRPSIFVLPQRGLDRELAQRATLGEAKGIVIRVAPDAPEVRARTAVLHALLIDATSARAQKEDRHVLLDGLTTWWVLRDDPAGLEREWLRAAAAPPLTASTLERWNETSEQLGPCLADAVAFATVATLVDRLGEPRALELLRAIFAPPHEDVRVLFETGPARRLADVGLSWPELGAAVEAARSAAADRGAQTLVRRPALSAQLTPRRSDAKGRTLEASVTGAPAWTAHALKLAPWAAQATGGQRLDTKEPTATLPLTLARGDAVWAALEVEDAVLDCKVRVLSRRLEIE